MGLYSEIARKVENNKALIGITGGGGKTTLMECLGEYFKNNGYSVLITTTTKVASPYIHDYRVDYIYSDSTILQHEAKREESVFLAYKSDTANKWKSPELSLIMALRDRFDIIIYEADGSRGLPLKIHTERDPVIIDGSSMIIGIMGLWGIGHSANEMCFGSDSDSIIDKEYLEGYLESREGLSKGMDRANNRMFLFNGADSASPDVIDIMKSCRMDKDIDSYIVSIREDRIYANV